MGGKKAHHKGAQTPKVRIACKGGVWAAGGMWWNIFIVSSVWHGCQVEIKAGNNLLCVHAIAEIVSVIA